MTRLSVSQDLQRNLRKYDRETSIVFFKTKEEFGGLSNMAGGYPLQVNGIDIRSSEALYQACRFPHRSDLQSLIIEQKSPMTAKMKTKPYRKFTRPDWDQMRIEIMRWCLKVKLAQNWLKFSNLLIETGDRPIVEQSRRDDFWGAVPANDEKTLVGRNALGRLLMELREAITNSRVPDVFLIVDPTNIPDFKLDNRTIERVVGRASLASETVGVVQEPMVEMLDEKAEQLGFNLNELASRPVHQVHEDTESNSFRQVKSDIGPYPEYRDSGVEWLGKVPAHWEIRRLRNVADMRVSNVDKHVKDGENPVRLCNYVDVYNNDYINKRMDFMHATATNEEIERFRLERNDVLITKDSETWVDIGVPALVTEPAWDLILGYHLALLRPRPEKLAGAYLLRALQSKGLAYQFHVEAKGVTRYGLSLAGITSVWLPLPSLSEQAAIVRFLDHADGCIQRYIQAKQKLLQLLEEQKQAVIHQAVTGQIDARTGQRYPAYKDSGVEWLGDVPAHWQIAALHHRYSQCLGKMLDSKRITGNHLLPYLRNVDVQWDQINTMDLPTMDIAPEEYERYTVQHCDLLVCEGGEIGRCALWSGGLPRCGFQKALHRLRPRNAREDMPRYMCYALRAAAKADAFNDGHLSTIGHLTGEKLRVHRFPFPPVAEQDLLVRFLDSVVEQIDHSVSCVHRQIDLLQEYRTRLIANVVTGTLDVRMAVVELPE